jgi:hypothetical protein
MSLFRSGFLLLFALATLVLPAGGGTAGEAARGEAACAR